MDVEEITPGTSVEFRGRSMVVVRVIGGALVLTDGRTPAEGDADDLLYGLTKDHVRIVKRAPTNGIRAA